MLVGIPDDADEGLANVPVVGAYTMLVAIV
jgi:hypothetical protein